MIHEIASALFILVTGLLGILAITQGNLLNPRL